ncbi:hypothetical protein M438DRAFT_201927 [Aureobasidium pullulans EXF-150]|uniref:Uncharacterized protein n=1 Tax=Aureobasidium pullulans EXF-150 TaxID=1043002 RepID=A0A074XH64_AURPU|nr:uncharacterized protein M438DRAFT_201927 [Aureobasidium pullulans EXF-150]KEQ84830.1 hypothetical protein M438DRAFT_201927 [Aureobasidium pullulans EXF-150]
MIPRSKLGMSQETKHFFRVRATFMCVCLSRARGTSLGCGRLAAVPFPRSAFCGEEEARTCKCQSRCPATSCSQIIVTARACLPMRLRELCVLEPEEKRAAGQIK